MPHPAQEEIDKAWLRLQGHRKALRKIRDEHLYQGQAEFEWIATAIAEEEAYHARQQELLTLAVGNGTGLVDPATTQGGGDK